MWRWSATLQKARRKDVGHYMGKLEEIVAVFEEIDEVKRQTTPYSLS
jgi:hypothetical protein